MTKRKAVWMAVFLVGVIAVLGIIYGIYNVQDIKLSQSQIQEKIDAKLPLVRGDVIVTKVSVNFVYNSLHLMMDAEGKKWGQKFSISSSAVGKPRFNSQNGTFYCEPEDFGILSLNIKGDSLSKKTEKFIDKWVDSSKIQSNKEAIGKKVEEWVFSSIEDTAVWALKRIPVYSLPDTFKANVFRLLLKDVEIKDGNLILHLSFLKFTLTAVFYILLVVICIIAAFGLMMNPEWGVMLILLTGWGDN